MSIDPSDKNRGADPGAIAPVVPASTPAQGTDEVAGITREVRRRIGRNLRLLYAEVLTQPLPDRFDALLADLAARTDTRGSS